MFWWDVYFGFCRYASLYFVVGIEPGDNELIALESIHRYVELLDKYFGNVSMQLQEFCPYANEMFTW